MFSYYTLSVTIVEVILRINSPQIPFEITTRPNFFPRRYLNISSYLITIAAVSFHKAVREFLLQVKHADMQRQHKLKSS